jgi:signal transduction histidine kinase
MRASFRYMGLQRRIILYAAFGLALMFGVFAYLGFNAVDRTTQLVLQERVKLAQSVAAAVEQSLDHLVSDVLEEVVEGAGRPPPVLASELYRHFTEVDAFALMHISGVWVLDGSGRLLGSAPNEVGWGEDWAEEGQRVAREGRATVVESVSNIAGGIPFAVLAVPISDEAGAVLQVVMVHTEARSTVESFNPYTTLETASGRGLAIARGGPGPVYNLEVITSDGIVVLGVGPDTTPGQLSQHFSLVGPLVAQRSSGAMLHRMPRGGADHTVAVVPLRLASYYLILEQEQDELVALPGQLRLQWLLFGGLGYLIALGAVWVTTRHVVKPTRSLASAAQRIAGGDLAAPVAVEGQDEIGALAQSFEVMRQQLRGAQEGLEIANRELEARVKERTARLEELLSKVISAQEDERQRLARELHDETAQDLGALAILLDTARDGVGGPDAHQQLAEARALTGRLLEDTRRLILDLRPTVLDDMGLLPALRWYAETHLEDRGIKVAFRARMGKRLPSHMEVALFRIVQEALSNVSRHSGAKNAWVELSCPGSAVEVTVGDDGQGFDVARVLSPGVPSRAVGILGMQERVSLLGGNLTISSVHGQGTQLHIRIPWEGAGEGGPTG